MDVFNAHQSVAEVIQTISSIRDDEDNFSELFSEMESMTALEKPRTTKSQTLRANHEVDSLEKYIRVAYFLPYVDILLNELKARFETSHLLTSG